jgi:hypothetical protein
MLLPWPARSSETVILVERAIADFSSIKPKLKAWRQGGTTTFQTLSKPKLTIFKA